MPALMPRDRVVYKGTVPTFLLSLEYVVTFAEPMPGDYDIYFTQPPGLTIAGTSNKTLVGFTINLSVSLAGTVVWAAVEKR